ncbi:MULTISPECIES: hypothetical protein [unclassified Bacillus (in: firmicutes)]|uniref:hypothetical protein n=1 Tax=unclassified Bacillus (in: firmicutes) TaxID=185979 RepID=UPI0008E8E6A6|nr:MULTISPECIES: hypothetical protein [unclassified Bacillus (in: firmicutes)]SFA86872.1 hypothetical protein SAMN02799634_102173 [Bacillus sp. UNCCL13]SFQ83922.1 hypothetical protein SAMN04488577_2293 [Bacillus sp. cl95]
MTFKSLLVTLSALVLTTGTLYLIGHTFTIPALMFSYESSNSTAGFDMTAGSFLPLIIGLIVSFFAEKFYSHKLAKN